MNCNYYSMKKVNSEPSLLKKGMLVFPTFLPAFIKLLLLDEYLGAFWIYTKDKGMTDKKRTNPQTKF